MQKTVQVLFFIAFVFGINSSAIAAPPINDSTCNAIDLGIMPAPGLCPNSPDGAYVNFSGTTISATFNPLDFSITHCYSAPSPDVWYRLQATGSYLYVSVVGSAGFNYFVKLHHSQGSCLSLVPLDCITSSGNLLTYSFPTPVMNGEYYLQIGGSGSAITGNFAVQMKSYNDCSGCVKRGNVHMNPAPAFGRFNMGDTVEMCTTVSRWESLATSYLHGIVPVFGPDWDTLSIVPTVIPTAVSTSQGWHWTNNISTPSGTHSGFFFDGDNDGNPSNNPGDNGNVLSSWTGCWKIKSIVPCVTHDLSVDVHLYSDGETGNGSPLFVCNPYDAIHISTASQCCPPPYVNIIQSPGCSVGNATAVVGGANFTNTYNFSLVDTSMHVIQNFNNVIGVVTFSGLNPGQYYVVANDITSGCVSYQTITIFPGMSLAMQQTFSGCSSGQGQAVVSVINSTNTYFTYNWIGVPISDTQDSLAFNLPDGWVHVIVTDSALGCQVEDSINIFSQGIPDPTFNLDDSPVCANADSIPLAGAPNSPGGTFTLIAPTTGGITVSASSGTIYLNNTTLSPPFYIYVKYTVGTSCQTAFIDSVLIVAVPLPPTATSTLIQNYCIGSPAPLLTVVPPASMYALWYDIQTAGYSLTNDFQTPLDASTVPGTYYYAVVTVFTLTGGCTSSAVVFTVNALPAPIITSSNDTDICAGGIANVAVYGCPTCSFVWSPAPTSGSQFSSSFQTSPSTSTDYLLVATDPGTGCTSYEDCYIWIINCGDSTHLNYYHGITPNGDGHNDTWIIDGLDSLSNAHVTIFNRWGNRVWEGYDYDNNKTVWKGENMNNQQLPDGTYFFLISIGDTHLNGWVELSH